jgi:hypothetical protein
MQSLLIFQSPSRAYRDSRSWPQHIGNNRRCVHTPFLCTFGWVCRGKGCTAFRGRFHNSDSPLPSILKAGQTSLRSVLPSLATINPDFPSPIRERSHRRFPVAVAAWPCKPSKYRSPVHPAVRFKNHVNRRLLTTTSPVRYA